MAQLSLSDSRADVGLVEMTLQEAIEEGAKMVRDERGVRLAREPEDAD